MKSKDYTISFLVEQTPTEVFNAINNVRGWWSETLKGNSEKLNDEFIYEHKPYHRSTQKLIEVMPGKKVVWLVTESEIFFVEDKSEWKNTKICFEIFEEKNKTKMVFTHFGLVPQIECFDNCSKGWNYYLKESLLPLITTGKGQPDKKILKK